VLGTAPIGVSDAIVCSAAAGLSLLTIEAMKGVWREDDSRALLPTPDRQNGGPILPLKPETLPA